jgi:hypothetical protein
VTLILRRIKWPPDGKPSAKPDYHGDARNRLAARIVRLPDLRRRVLATQHVFRDRRLGDLEPEHQELFPHLERRNWGIAHGHFSVSENVNCSMLTTKQELITVAETTVTFAANKIN